MLYLRVISHEVVFRNSLRKMFCNNLNVVDMELMQKWQFNRWYQTVLNESFHQKRGNNRVLDTLTNLIYASNHCPVVSGHWHINATLATTEWQASVRIRRLRQYINMFDRFVRLTIVMGSLLLTWSTVYLTFYLGFFTAYQHNLCHMEQKQERWVWHTSIVAKLNVL
jgi:hypothetical protein